MPRSVKESDDDLEPKGATGRMQTRMLTIHTVNSPLRRSSRISIKQNKYSPGSESDSSISSNQTTRSSRGQTATGVSTVSDTMKKLRPRKNSASSEVSEIDVEGLGTPRKRHTRQNSSTTSTPTKVITRASNKRLMRAGSEINLECARITRSTRANSVGPESLSNQNKNKSGTPTKTTRRRASMVPLSSQSKEQIELKDRAPYVKLDATIAETDEVTSSGNSDSSPAKALRFTQNKKINKNRQSIDKDENEKNSSCETLHDSKSEERQLSKEKDRAQAEDMNKVTMKNTKTIVTEVLGFVTMPPSNDLEEVIIDSSSPSSQNSVKDKKTEAESLSDLESSLIEICQSKESESMPENLLNTSGEEQKNNKENQMLNIINDAEKGMPKVILSSVQSLALPFTANKSLNEKEIKSMKKELNSIRRRSRESTEIAIKHNDLSKETADSSPEKMDISAESLNSSVINKSIVSQHDNSKLVDIATNKDKTSVENISTPNEDTTEICEKTSELDKIDKIECTTVNSKDSNRMKSNEEETSRSSPCMVRSKQISDDRENFASLEDDDEMNLTLDEQSPSRDKKEVLAHFNNKSYQLIDLHITTPNESSDDEVTIMKKQSVQDKVIDSSVSTELKQEQATSSKHVTESVSKSSNIVLKTNNSACDVSIDATIQDNQSFDKMEASKISTMDISPEKMDTEDFLLKKMVKRKSTDNLEGEKESSQMETSQKDQEDTEIDDVNIGIDLFQNIPADKWKEKNDAETNAVQATSQSTGEMENGSESSADLLLMNKQAWLMAETIKAAKTSESFECDSDDTIDLLWQSQSDASRANHSMEKSDTVNTEFLMNDIEDEENEKQVKKQQSRTIKRLTTEIDQDSPPCAEDKNDLVNADKSLNESKTALNQTNDRSISRLDRSGSVRREQSLKANKDSDEKIEDDTSDLNKKSLNKKNTSLRKSINERILNKSLKDTSVQNVSVNIARVDNSEEELDNTDACTGKKLDKKKHSLNKSYNKETDTATKSGKKNMSTKDSSKKNENTSLNRSVEKSKSVIEKLTHLIDDESSNSDVNIVPMEFESRTYSIIANAGSDSDCEHIPYYLFEKARSDGDSDDSNSNSDINKEYNLDGAEQKFSDDDVIADECRTSEAEFSDSDDNGSDLADFIIDDDEVEDEEENNEEEDNNEEDNDDEKDDDNEEDDDNNEDDSDEDIQDLQDTQKEEVKDEDKQSHIDIKLENMEIENDENVQEDEDTTDEEEDENQFTEMEAISSYVSTSDKLPNIHKSKNKSIIHTSPRTSETEIERDIKMKKLDSNLSTEKKKKKSLTKKNETILSETSNLISSSTKKRKLDPQYFSKNRAERNSTGQLNEFELMSARKLSKSIEFSTPKLNICKKLGLDETLERTSESKNKSHISEVTQITMKEKSKEDPILNKNSSLKLFSDAHKDMAIAMSHNDFSPDLLELIKFKNVFKSTPSKAESRKSMNIQIETPTIKHLRKEKLNESAPMLINNNSLQKKLFIENKDAAQTKIKEKNNEDEIVEVITLSNDDVIQKCSKKKQKKRKEQESSKENIIEKILPDDTIKLDVAEKKKPVKFIQLTSIEDNTHKSVNQINEKKKKKKKQDTSKEHITSKTLSEDVIEANVSKKKKRVKFTELTSVEDDTREDVCQINEKKKKKKKQDTSKENIIIKSLSEDVIEANVPKKKKLVKLTQLTSVENDIRDDVCQISEKKKKKKKQDTSKEHIISKALSEDVIEVNVPKKKKRVKFTQLTSLEDDTCEDVCQMNEKKKKKKKQDTLKEYITDEVLSEELNIPKKKKSIKFIQSLIVKDDKTREDTYQINEKQKKKKKQETSKENITEKTVFENVVKLIPKKQKLAKRSQLAIVQDNIREDAYQFNEKQKKKKKQKSKEDIVEKVLSEDVEELQISKKKKHANLNKLAIVQNNASEDACQVNKIEKNNKKKQINVVEQDINELDLFEYICQNATEFLQHKKKYKFVSFESDSPVNKQEKLVKKKAKRQKMVESIETSRTEKKKHTLPIQIPVSKLKSGKVLLSDKLQKTALDISESKNVAHSTKELKSKKKRHRSENIENENHTDILAKKLKTEVKEVNKILPSSSGLKRLSDEVIENLADLPTRAKKRQKISKTEEKIVSSKKMGKSKTATATRDAFLTSQTSGCTTQFRVVNVQDTKKLSRPADAVASFRQRMLNRNAREPMSAYLIYHDKIKNAK